MSAPNSPHHSTVEVFAPWRYAERPYKSTENGAPHSTPLIPTTDPPAPICLHMGKSPATGNEGKDQDDDGKVAKFDFVDVWSTCANCFVLLTSSRTLNTMRFANSIHEHERAGQQFREGAFHKLHLRFTSKYKYHPLQRRKNLIRRFNATNGLVEHMKRLESTTFFYHVVCARPIENAVPPCYPDLTSLDSVATIFGAANYLYDDFSRHSSEAQAAKVKKCFERGFSRKINVYDLNDWQAFRMELLSGYHAAKNQDYHTPDQYVLPIAVSYKSNILKLTRRMFLLEDDWIPRQNGNSLTEQEHAFTSDFLDDFRWGQLVRTCLQIAKKRKTHFVCLWIDLLVTMELTAEDKKGMLETINWWDFGLMCYAVCPVVRLYEQNEVEFGTDFWRKIETVLGIAGRGLYVDDYLLRVFDRTIYYGPELYKRLESGIAMIGGDGVYLRAVTLALATAVMTDGITVRGVNEDTKTINAISGFKAWALRTIGEGAYSRSHAAFFRIEDPYVVGYEQFRTIVTWEAFVSTSDWLTGQCYMDLSYQRSQEWRSEGYWDGVVEWIGMVKKAAKIEQRGMIMEFLNSCVKVRSWAATSGHASSMLTLEVDDVRQTGVKRRKLKRSLVVALSRFSNSSNGHVSAVAEATGLWGGRILPFYLRFGFSTHRYQIIEKFMEQMSSDEEDATYVVRYEHAPIYFLWPPIVWWYAIVYTTVFILYLIYISKNPNTNYSQSFGFAILLLILTISFLFMLYGLWYIFIFHMTWPWADDSGFGEAVFDNVLMHSLYNSGIKVFDYRQLEPVKYGQLNWK